MNDRSQAHAWAWRGLRTVVRATSVLVAASVMVFILMDALPGDAAVILARTSQPEIVDGVRSDLGLNRPMLERLIEWASALFLHADGGSLYSTSVPVWEAASTPARNTAVLVCCAVPLLLAIGVGTGVLAGTRPTSLRDNALSAGAQTTLATPDFAITTVLLLLLAGVLRLVPAVSLVPPGGTPLDRPQALIVPSLAIALTGGAWLQRMVRGAIVDAAALPHVKAALLAGYHPMYVTVRHTFPAAAAPIVQACAATLPYAVAGTVVVENVVGYPGVGSMLATLIGAQETVAVSSLTVVLAAITVVVFLLADAVGTRRSPRAQS